MIEVQAPFFFFLEGFLSFGSLRPFPKTDFLEKNEKLTCRVKSSTAQVRDGNHANQVVYFFRRFWFKGVFPTSFQKPFRAKKCCYLYRMISHDIVLCRMISYDIV